MWKKITDNDLIESIQDHSFSSIPKKSAIKITLALLDKEYAKDMYAVIGFEKFSFSFSRYHETFTIGELQLNISTESDEIMNVSYSSRNNSKFNASITGNFEETIRFIDRVSVSILQHH
jgi:hypothetical protein